MDDFKALTNSQTQRTLLSLYTVHDDIRSTIDIAMEFNDHERLSQLWKILRSVVALIDSFKVVEQ